MDKIGYNGFQSLLSTKGLKRLAVEYVHGYLTAIVCAPVLILPSTWLSIIFGEEGDQIDFKSQEDANKFIMPVMEMYNDISAALTDKSFQPLYSLTDKTVTTVTAKSWCKGFILGLNLWQKSFISDEKARLLILPVIMIADSESVMDSMKLDHKKEYSAEAIKSLKRESLIKIPENMIALRYYYQKNPPVKKDKIGRNEPCPCGSGKKYKKCCGN